MNITTFKFKTLSIWFSAILILTGLNLNAQQINRAADAQRISTQQKATATPLQQASNGNKEQATEQSLDQSPFDAVKGLREDVSKRDASSKHYINEDGSFTALIGAGPIHYERNGQFLDIDHTITQGSNFNYPYVNNTNLMESHFGATAHKGVMNKTAEGEVKEFLNTRMYWEVNGQEVGTVHSADVQAAIQNDKAYYNNLYGNISAEFVVLTGKRELNYIIPNQQALGNIPSGADYLVFTEDVVLPFGWTHAITEEGILIKDTLGTEMYLYNNPVSTDANIELRRETNTIFETQLLGNTLHIKTKVKTDWLLDNERQYPIRVDPTVTANPSNNQYWTGSAYEDDYKDDSTIAFGRWESNLVRAWAKFNINSLPSDEIIVSEAKIHYYLDRVHQDYSPIYGHSLIFSQMLIDPALPTSTGDYLFNLIQQFGYLPFQTEAINSLGWKKHGITSNSLTTDINNQKSLGWFSLGFMPDGVFYEGEYLRATGYNTNTKPYLIINYIKPVGDCIQGDGNYTNFIDDGYGISETGYKVADDFIVSEGEIFTLKQITFDILTESNITSPNVSLNFLKDISDSPGDIEHSISMQPSEVFKFNNLQFGMFSHYRLTFNLSEGQRHTFTEGKYWLQPSIIGNAVIYWATTDSGVTGSPLQVQDPGLPWSMDYQYGLQANAIFYVIGDCEEAIVEDCDITATWTANGWEDNLIPNDPEGVRMHVVFNDFYEFEVGETMYACSVVVNDEVIVSNSSSLFVDEDVEVYYWFEIASGGTVDVGNEFLTEGIVEVSGDLIVHGAVTNIEDPDLFVVLDGGNLVQWDDEAENLGEITVEKEFTFSPERNQYNFVMSPVEDQDISDIFSPQTIENVFIYDPSDDFFKVAPNYSAKVAFAIQEAEGGSSDPSAIYIGEISNGVHTFPISIVGNGYNLIGNPYPSNLDLDKLYTTNSGIIGSTFWFWDNTGNQEDEQQGGDYGTEYEDTHQYAIYNSPSTTGNPAPGVGESGKKPNKNASVGAGFIVQAENGGILTIDNSHRTTEAPAAVFLGKGNNFNPTSDKDRYWLNLISPNELRITTAVVYFEGGDDAFTVDDSKNPGGSFSLYSLVDEQEVAIQGKAPFNNKDIVPLGYKAITPGFYTISIHDMEGVFAEGQKIYIKDNLLGTTHDLTIEDFIFKTAPGEFNDRFEIIYKKSHKASDNQAKLANVIIQRKDHNIDITSEELKIVDVEVYDLNGTLLHSSKAVNKTEVQIPNINFNKQLLIVVVKTEDGQVVNRKLINN